MNSHERTQARFLGGTIIVTGAGSGIGAGIARAFCAEGATVYGLDLDGERVRAVAEACRGGRGAVLPIAADVSRPSDVTDAFAQVLAVGNRIDILVNNAGINMDRRLTELELEDWDKVFEVNLRSAYLTAKLIWPHFVARRTGNIVNIGSIMGLVGGVGAPAYCASKSALVMLTRCLAKDGAPHGIRVNSVCPGYIETPIMERFFASQPDPVGARATVITAQPFGRMGTVNEVAQAVLFLASEQASFVSGISLIVDGALSSTQID